MFPFFGGKIPHPEKNKKRDLVKSISEAEICFALRPSEGRQHRLKSWGYQQRAGSRWHGKGFTEALAAVPPKKPVPKQRAVLPALVLNLADFLAPKPTSFAKKTPNLVSSTVMFPAGGKQVGKGFFQSAIFVAESASCRRESTKHWQPTLVEMTRHLNLLSFLRGVPRFAVRSHRLHPSKHKLRSQTSLTDLHVPPYKEDTRPGPLPIKT